MRLPAIALTAVLALLAGGGTALASGRDVIRDCTDDEVLAKTYTQKEYRDALAKLPADADQYGNCRDIIARAQEAAATKGGSKTKTDTGSSTGAPSTKPPDGQTPPPASSKPAAEQLAAATPDERAAAEAAAKDAAVPEVSAAEVAADPGDSSSDLPTPIVVLLALLLAGALALAAVGIRNLVNARRA